MAPDALAVRGSIPRAAAGATSWLVLRQRVPFRLAPASAAARRRAGGGVGLDRGTSSAVLAVWHSTPCDRCQPSNLISSFPFGPSKNGRVKPGRVSASSTKTCVIYFTLANFLTRAVLDRSGTLSRAHREARCQVPFTRARFPHSLGLLLPRQLPPSRYSRSSGSSRQAVETVRKLQYRSFCRGVAELARHLPCLFGAIEPLQRFIQERRHLVLPLGSQEQGLVGAGHGSPGPVNCSSQPSGGTWRH